MRKPLLCVLLTILCASAQAQQPRLPVLLTSHSFRTLTPARVDIAEGDGTVRADPDAPRWTRVDDPLLGGMEVLYVPETQPARWTFGYDDAALAVALCSLEVGTYEVHILMQGQSSASDAVLLLLDGAPPRGSDGVRPVDVGSGIRTGTYRRWAWARTYASGYRIELRVQRAGLHDVTLVAREPGVRVAALLLIHVSSAPVP